jgi:1-acyl-sn-glycerol-3-phosphate acyltransferase
MVPILTPLWIILAMPFSMLLLLMVITILSPIYAKNTQHQRVFSYISHNASHLLNHFFFRLNIEVEGQELIPLSEPVVFYVNHKSYTDPFVLLAHIKRPLAFASKKAVYNLPIIGLWLRGMRTFMVDRKSDRDTAKRLIEAIETVKSGHAMAIFPEGGTKDRASEEVLQMKAGAFKIAQKAKAIIMPVRIVGNIHVRHRMPFFHTNKKLIFLNPIPFSDYQDLSTQQLAEMVLKKINEAN